jgi:hypothetical protein
MKKNIFLKFQRILFTILIFFLLISAGCSGGGGGGSSGDGGSPGNGGIINLGWSANTESDLAGYKVYYGTSSGDYGTPIDIGMGTLSGVLTTYSLTNLTKGQTYCIAITAYDNSNNESILSTEVCGEAQ